MLRLALGVWYWYQKDGLSITEHSHPCNPNRWRKCHSRTWLGHWAINQSWPARWFQFVSFLLIRIVLGLCYAWVLLNRRPFEAVCKFHVTSMTMCPFPCPSLPNSKRLQDSASTYIIVHLDANRKMLHRIAKNTFCVPRIPHCENFELQQEGSVCCSIFMFSTLALVRRTTVYRYVYFIFDIQIFDIYILFIDELSIFWFFLIGHVMHNIYIIYIQYRWYIRVCFSSRLHSARQRLDADALDRDERAFIEKMEAPEA